MNKKSIIFIVLLSIMCLSPRLLAQDLTHFSQNKSSFSGNISTSGSLYNANGMTPRRDPFTGIVSGNFNINLKGFNMPFSFVYSNQNKSFRQPFNQFGLSPKYKWATLHLGYRNIKFSKYVLGSHTFFGIGMELNPGKFRFGAVYGKLKKSTNKAVNIFRSDNDLLADYNRNLMSVKIGFGSQKNFFDINIMRAVDDTTSVGNDYKQKGIFPEANLVAGIHTKFTIAKNISFETEVAYSIYTANQNSETDFETFESVQKIIPVNISTSGSLAIESKFNYTSKTGFNVGLNYRRINPKYRSMGTYFISNDLENMTLKTAFKALKNKMQIGGSIGLERNNLKMARSATTHKTIGSLTINYNPNSKFGVSANYSNYSVNQQAGRVQIADSVKLYQTNGTLMLAPHYSFQSKHKKYFHFISLTLTQMQLTDKNTKSVYNSSFSSLNNILSYNLSIKKTGWSFSTSLNYNQIDMSVGNSTNIGASIGINKRLNKPKISIGLQTNYMQSTSSQRTINTITPTLNINTRLGKHHQIRVKTNMIMSNNTQLNGSTNEQFGDIRYVFTF